MRFAPSVWGARSPRLLCRSEPFVEPAVASIDPSEGASGAGRGPAFAANDRHFDGPDPGRHRDVRRSAML